MPKYSVHARVVGSKYIGEFEADSPEAAEELAVKSDAGCVSLCHQCSSECEDPQVEVTDVVLVEEPEEKPEEEPEAPPAKKPAKKKRR